MHIFINIYYATVIKPIEEKIKSLNEKIHSNSILKIIYKSKLKNYEIILMDKYEALGKLAKEIYESESKNLN